MPARNTLPIVTFGGGISGGSGILSLPGVNAHCVHVDMGTNPAITADGSRQLPFHTVAAALAWIVANLTPSAIDPVVLLIYPGEYNEDGLSSLDYVYWVGVGGREAVRIEGDDAIVLTVDDENTAYWGITFAQAAAATSILEINTGTDDPRVEFHECAFEGLGATGQPIEVQDGGVYFKDCHLVHADLTQLILAVANSANNDVVIEGCDSIVGVLDLDGGLFRMEHSRVYGEDLNAVIQIANVGVVEIRHCQITADNGDCVQFTAQPNTAVFQSNRLWCASPHYDLNATLAVTGFSIEGNHMQRGIAGNISHLLPERLVGDVASGNFDFYSTVQDALDACTFDDIVVRMLDDKVVTAALTPPSRPLTIDGYGFHTLTRANATLMVCSGTDDVTIRDTDIGSSISVTDDAHLRVERCAAVAVALAAGGSASCLVEIVRSTVIADNFWLWPLRMQDADPTLLIKRSRIRGWTGREALRYEQTNDNVKIEHSVLWHGSGAANSPIGRSAAQTPDYASHHDAYNTDPLAAGWLTNLIAVAQRYNSYDVQTDY